jgi:CD63 antigen
MECCVAIFQFLVFLCNFIFFFAGIFIIGSGAFLAIELKNYFDFFATSELSLGMDISPYILIVMGLLITIISFLGCCGACTDNTCMMYSFGSLMAIIIMAEIGILVALFVYKDEVIMTTHKAMDDGMKNYQKPGFEGVTFGWDQFQRNLKCCGIVNATNWNEKPFQIKTNDAPDSCCTVEFTGCGEGQLKSQKSGLHDLGCLTSLEDYVEDNQLRVLVISLSIVVVQCITFIGSICVAKKMTAMPDED